MLCQKITRSTWVLTVITVAVVLQDSRTIIQAREMQIIEPLRSVLETVLVKFSLALEAMYLYSRFSMPKQETLEDFDNRSFDLLTKAAESGYP